MHQRMYLPSKLQLDPHLDAFLGVDFQSQYPKFELTFLRDRQSVRLLPISIQHCNKWILASISREHCESQLNSFTFSRFSEFKNLKSEISLHEKKFSPEFKTFSRELTPVTGCQPFSSRQKFWIQSRRPKVSRKTKIKGFPTAISDESILLGVIDFRNFYPRLLSVPHFGP